MKKILLISWLIVAKITILTSSGNFILDGLIEPESVKM